MSKLLVSDEQLVPGCTCTRDSLPPTSQRATCNPARGHPGADKGGEDVEEVPNTTFEVSRVAYSDNKSSYYVDGRPSSFGEVTELLKGKGIDLDNNRFLILQGEVEQISMMKPKGQDKNDTGENRSSGRWRFCLWCRSAPNDLGTPSGHVQA